MFSEKKYVTYRHHSNICSVPLFPIMVIGIAVLAAFVFWTIPTWIALWPHLPRLSELWQTDQRSVLLLLVKLCSPLLVGLLFGAGLHLWQLIDPYLRRYVAALEHPQTVFEPAQRHPSTNRSNSLPASTDRPVFPSARRRKTLVGESFSPSHPVVPLLPSLILSGSRTQSPSVRNGAYKRGRAASRLTQMQQREASTHVALLRTRRQERLHGLHSKPSVREVMKERGEGLTPTTRDDIRVQAAPLETLSAPLATLTSQSSEQEPQERQDVPLLTGGHTVTIRLLHRVSLMLHAQEISRQVSFALNAKRVILLAYIAWQRGKEIQRDRLLEHVFGHGKDDEDATKERLGEAFDSHKKLMRLSLREAITQMNTEAGYEVLSPDLNLFTHRHKLYTLSDVCSVVDLDAIEAEHQIIEQARKQGLLTDVVPIEAKQACDRLIAAYTGDFLEELIVNYLEEFQPWASSWAREPYTLYRDYYLDALWYSAEYELHRGLEVQASGGKSDLTRRKQRRHWEIAAQNYRTYAMKACDSRFDMKVTFKRPGERTIMSERALRRCLVLYGSIGATHLVDQVYAAYSQQMREISGKAWEPSAETLADLQAAKEHTSEYRFPNQLALHETGRL